MVEGLFSTIDPEDYLNNMTKVTDNGNKFGDSSIYQHCRKISKCFDIQPSNTFLKNACQATEGDIDWSTLRKPAEKNKNICATTNNHLKKA